ncbi:RraA-like protein [Atractiella rhizophila]|nr:RraA-like protein [Atractiella rhizophila]
MSTRSPSKASLISAYSTCELSDALVKLGHASGGHLSSIQPISPSNKDSICGPAYTVEMVSLPTDLPPPTLPGHYVDCAPRGSVMVISTPRTLKSAVLGGLLALRAKIIGVAGVVVDGRIRDRSEMELPVFSRGFSTLGQGTFSRPQALDVPITIKGEDGFPDVIIRPGDIVKADEDGVVVVPLEKVEEVLEKCKSGREADERVKEDLLKGVEIAEAFKRHR